MISNDERVVRLTIAHHAVSDQDKAKRLGAFAQTELNELLGHLLSTLPEVLNIVQLSETPSETRPTAESHVNILGARLKCCYTVTQSLTQCAIQVSSPFVKITPCPTFSAHTAVIAHHRGSLDPLHSSRQGYY